MSGSDSASLDLPLYKCESLGRDEIRLVDLLPSDYDDEICLIISKWQIQERQYSEKRRLCREDLQKSLRTPWKVFEIPEGRYFFSSNSDGHTTTGYPFVQYEHPIPGFSRDLYAHDQKCEDFVSKYEALSYVWGQEKESFSIHVVPETEMDAPSTLLAKASVILSRSNLITALKQLRHRDRRRKLWIDAICIDQSNDTERAEQVRKMSQIFSRAATVLLWLGPASNDSESAISLLQYLGEQIEISKEDDWIFIQPGAIEPQLHKLAYHLPLDNLQWKAIQQLVERPYFERLWSKCNVLIFKI